MSSLYSAIRCSSVSLHFSLFTLHYGRSTKFVQSATECSCVRLGPLGFLRSAEFGKLKNTLEAAIQNKMDDF